MSLDFTAHLQSFRQLSWPIQVRYGLLLCMTVGLAWVLIQLAQGPDSTPEETMQSNTGVSPVTKQASGIDVQPILTAHLFGQKPQTKSKPTSPVVRKTTLKLTLHGVYATEDKKGGVAVISSNQGKAKVYPVDTRIQSGVKLAEVRRDCVILERNGQWERLDLTKVKDPGKPNLTNLPNHQVDGPDEH